MINSTTASLRKIRQLMENGYTFSESCLLSERRLETKDFALLASLAGSQTKREPKSYLVQSRDSVVLEAVSEAIRLEEQQAEWLADRRLLRGEL